LGHDAVGGADAGSRTSVAESGDISGSASCFYPPLANRG
jgi:hypothetical protein